MNDKTKKDKSPKSIEELEAVIPTTNYIVEDGEISEIDDDAPQGPEDDSAEAVEEAGEAIQEQVTQEVIADRAELQSQPEQERPVNQRLMPPAPPVEESPTFKKHSNRGQLAVQFTTAIVGRMGLKGDTKQIVEKGFQLADALQAEIDRAYNAEMTQKITGQ